MRTENRIIHFSGRAFSVPRNSAEKQPIVCGPPDGPEGKGALFALPTRPEKRGRRKHNCLLTSGPGAADLEGSPRQGLHGGLTPSGRMSGCSHLPAFMRQPRGCVPFGGTYYHMRSPGPHVSPPGSTCKRSGWRFLAAPSPERGIRCRASAAFISPGKKNCLW